MGIEKQRVSGIENGHIPMGKELLERFCKAFKVKPYEFYLDEETPVIANKKEEAILYKYREAEALAVAERVEHYMKYVIDEEHAKRGQKPGDKGKRKK